MPPNWQAAVPFWQQVEWDGKTGAGVQGMPAWAWLLNVQHTYLANRCIDLGKGALKFTVAGHCWTTRRIGDGRAAKFVHHR